MITELQALEGRTIRRAVKNDWGDILLKFEDGEFAIIQSGCEEGGHWAELGSTARDLARAFDGVAE